MMSRALLPGAVLLAMTASLASAAPGVNLRWESCFGDGGAINRNFACDTNAGSSSLVGSFEFDVPLLFVSGVELVVDLAAASSTLPEWWEFRNPGSCRMAALSIRAIDGVSCFDWAVGQASMHIAAYDASFPAPNGARIKVLNALVFEGPDLAAATEYVAFALAISHGATVGTTCTGCAVPACIVFNSIGAASPVDLSAHWISGPTNGSDSHYVTWQGGVGISVPGRGEGCPAATPSRRATWSGVKSQFR